MYVYVDMCVHTHTLQLLRGFCNFHSIILKGVQIEGQEASFSPLSDSWSPPMTDSRLGLWVPNSKQVRGASSLGLTPAAPDPEHPPGTGRHPAPQRSKPRLGGKRLVQGHTARKEVVPAVYLPPTLVWSVHLQSPSAGSPGLPVCGPHPASQPAGAPGPASPRSSLQPGWAWAGPRGPRGRTGLPVRPAPAGPESPRREEGRPAPAGRSAAAASLTPAGCPGT